MNICGKRKYINPYSRGAVLCKLAERQMKGKFKRTWTHQEKERERVLSYFKTHVLKCRSSQGMKNAQSFWFFIQISKEEIGSM
ncbi:hypothetical protein Avbf_00429 [Armadillidium vulgare]|nr:hypothetical protein Avbf_05716 [Armadillidium vulgare]RXG68760.1 hypothetical protein Avbf_00429 [Armadillidium vulgare]